MIRYLLLTHPVASPGTCNVQSFSTRVLAEMAFGEMRGSGSITEHATLWEEDKVLFDYMPNTGECEV